MALAQAVLTSVLLCGFCLGFAPLGNRILRALHGEMASDDEQLLVAIAVGLISTEILLFLIGRTQHIRLACVAMPLRVGSIVRGIKVGLGKSKRACSGGRVQ